MGLAENGGRGRGFWGNRRSVGWGLERERCGKGGKELMRERLIGAE